MSSHHDAVTQHRRVSEADMEKHPYQNFSREGFLNRGSGGGGDEESPTNPLPSSSSFYYDTSSSSEPILGRPMPRRKKRLQFYRIPNRIMRFVCLAVFFALVFFVLSLFRFSLAPSVLKNVEVRLPIQKKPKPPQWESFDFLKRYYGGIRTLVSRKENVAEYPGEGFVHEEPEQDIEKNGKVGASIPSSVFDPYPNYKSQEYIKKFGTKADCFLDEANTVVIPQVRKYDGVPRGFPDNIMGSNELLGINNDICVDRFGRLGPYGFGYGVKQGGIGAGMEGERSGVDEVWKTVPPVDFRNVNWSEAQDRCVAKNNHRFSKFPASTVERFRSLPVGSKHLRKEPSAGEDSTPKDATLGSERLPRTAVVIRTWHDFHYTDEAIMYLRSLVSELSLLSGGEYVVHFLIHVKDVDIPIWSDDETYERVLRESLPQEFYGMGTLWTERQMGLIYGGLDENFARGLPVHGVYRSTYMPMQYFAQQHPEYDYFWNWEMDARYTGHYYELFERMGQFAKQQPRKGLWERNSRYYVPSVHGSWEDFRQMVRIQTDLGTTSPNNMWSSMNNNNKEGVKAGDRQGEKPIWGPERPADEDIMEVEGEVKPPKPYEQDQYEWGVGEDADLIVLNPLYDPEGTTWLLRDDFTGYNKEKTKPPRRAAIITASRLSRKLLQTMHRETSVKRHTMFSEMWPATTALHHGFKAVYAPHAMYVDRRWPPKYAESIFNGGRNGATGGARTAVFGDREHNFKGTTWFYSAEHSINVWRRWLGFRVNNDGGEEWELATEGRMCLPPMLLHPIKEVDLIIESGP